MTLTAWLYLAILFALVAILAIITFRTYRRDRKQELEAPKHRMLDDD